MYGGRKWPSKFKIQTRKPISNSKFKLGSRFSKLKLESRFVKFKIQSESRFPKVKVENRKFNSDKLSSQFSIFNFHFDHPLSPPLTFLKKLQQSLAKPEKMNMSSEKRSIHLATVLLMKQSGKKSTFYGVFQTLSLNLKRWGYTRY